VSEQVATIELHRRQAMNAFTHAMLTDLIDALDRVDDDGDIRAVIVTGAGDRAFCAGADLSLGVATFSEEKLRHRAAGGGGGVPRDSRGLAAMRLYRCRRPVIAAINGVAVGVGATMTLPMDIRLASTTARFGFVFARRGLVPEAASSWFLPRLVASIALSSGVTRVACSVPRRHSTLVSFAASTNRTSCRIDSRALHDRSSSDVPDVFVDWEGRSSVDGRSLDRPSEGRRESGELRKRCTVAVHRTAVS
jgi:hypothetical protein